MKNSKIIIILAMLSSILAGCAPTEPTKADYMRGHAAALQSEVDLRDSLAKDWDRGARLIKTGEKRVKVGEEQMAKGKENIEIGNQEILEGRMLIENSERMFHETFPGLKLEP
ncbi:MAG: hypothetical protein Q7U02_12620 [Desulfosalsimonadaceae bacterium]|nr:hypothetical protein [Desulfosalsimonadaceae bacterium]